MRSVDGSVFVVERHEFDGGARHAKQMAAEKSINDATARTVHLGLRTHCRSLDRTSKALSSHPNTNVSALLGGASQLQISWWPICGRETRLLCPAWHLHHGRIS